MRLICGCLIGILAIPAAGQDRPLPDYATFMAEVRKRLEDDDVAVSPLEQGARRREAGGAGPEDHEARSRSEGFGYLLAWTSSWVFSMASVRAVHACWI